MPTNHDETLHERYAREHQAHLAIYARMTPEQISDMATELHNALARLAALSQQAEPVRSPGTEDAASMDSNSAQGQFTATDMATAAAQGFRDGQAAVEPAPAQDERDFNPDHTLFSEIRCSMPVNDDGEETRYIINEQQLQRIRALEFNRPAQTEQQPVECTNEDSWNCKYCRKTEACEAIKDPRNFAAPVAQTAPQPEQSGPANKLRALAEIWAQNADEADEFGNAQAAETLRLAAFELRATLSAPQGKFRMGDLVKKSTGSEWVGCVVGWYSTEQTPEGYAVESSAHRNSVQIYPAKALEAVDV